MRTVALAALLAFGPVAVRADEPATYQAPTPAPQSYAPLGWRAEGVTVPGYWYSRPQVMAIQGRIDYLETRAAKECVEAQIAAPRVPTWLAVAAGVVVGGAVAYFGTRAALKR